MRAIGKRKGWLRGACRRDDGITAIEFALILPVLMLMFLGVFELSRYVWLQVKVDRVAASLGDLVAREESVDTNLINSVFLAASELTKPFPTGAASRVIITSISPNAAGKPKVNWQRSGGGTLNQTSRVAPCTGTIKLPTGLTLTASDVVIVTETFYSYTPVTGQGVVQPTIIYRNSFFRPRINALSTITDSPTVCG